ncbi:alpha/beta hydrolase, partial [Pseudomonas sp. HMWF031]
MPAEPEHWTWEQPDGRGLDVVWRQQGQDPESSDSPAVVLVHGFGASSGHWRYTMPSLATQTPTFALDLIGFGGSSQPKAVLPSDPDAQRPTPSDEALVYGFDLWAAQVEAFCRQIVQRPVLLVGNSIGGVVVLRAAQQ